MSQSVPSPVPPGPAPRAANPQRTSAVWVLAALGLAGLAIVGCSGILCAGVIGVRLLSRSSEAASADESAGFQLLDFAPDPLGAVGSEAPKIAALKERAAAGDVVAMRELGLGYRFGEGVSRDTAAAASWLKFAAEAGDAEAMYWYGQCLGAGEGVEADPFEGMQWISRSAQSGYEPAQRWIEQTRQEVVADAVGSILSALADQAAFGDFSSEPAYDEAAAQREWEYRRQQQADYWNNRAEQAEAFGNRDEAERYRRYAE